MTEQEFKQIVKSNICGDGYNANARMQEILDAHKATNKTIRIKSPQPKKGKWIKFLENDADGYRCSECGASYNYPYYVFEDYEEDAFLDDTHFCPNCGARNMRGEE